MHPEELQETIDRSYAKATPFTKKILGEPMNAAKTIRFINEKRDGILAIVKPSGRPQVSWTLLAYLDGKLYITEDPESLAYRSLLKHPEMAVAITDHSKGIFIEGTAKMIGAASKLRSTLIARIEGWSESQKHTGRWLPSDYKGYVFEITIKKVLTYDPI